MTEEQIHGEMEKLSMEIKHLERTIKDLTEQNYKLMKRISELVDHIRSSGGSLYDLP